MKIKFSAIDTGACPLCRNRKNCRILNSMQKLLLETVKEDHDDVFEVVIYRCPEFKDLDSDAMPGGGPA